jgi:phosphoglycerate dehydrogenase-like enzyme
MNATRRSKATLGIDAAVNMRSTFQVALTADFYNAAGEPKYVDLGLDVFTSQPQITVQSFTEHRPQIGADQLAGANGVVVLTPAVTRESVAAADNLLAIGRFGVGYDAVDVSACTAADVLVFITAGAVDRSVAEATVGWMIGLSHHFRVKDRLVREGKWDDRSRYMGSELRDRTLGVVGLGGIARKVLELLAGWGLKPPLAYDPHVDPSTAAKFGVRLVPLDELMRASDFVSIHCPLSPQTRGLIGAHELALMQPTAYVLNTARGGIVDEDALHDALRQGRIAGAALDCFAKEPVTDPHRLGELDNVLLAPHSIAWTNEMFRDIGQAACQGMVELSLKRRPRGVINPEVFDRPSFMQKWERLCS